MVLPPFDVQSGYLPYAAQLYRATEAEIEARLGSANSQRVRLFGHLRRLVAAARKVKAVRLLIDGTFVTDKERTQGEPPNDIDCAVWLPPTIGSLVREADADAMFIFGLNATNKFGPLDLHFAFSEAQWNEWVTFFGTDRDDVPKGCVEVVL